MISPPPRSAGLSYPHAPLSPANEMALLSQGMNVPSIPTAFGDRIYSMLNTSAGQFSSHLDNTAPTYNLSLMSSSNDVGNWVPPYPLLPAASPAPWTCVASPPTDLESLESGNPSFYRCLKCPNMPKFSSHKDLERHYNNKAHWSEETRFYRCSCAAFDRPRKDHHLRHVRFCGAQAVTPYTCVCGRECLVRREHVEHVTYCGRVRRRRQSTTP
ncbi:hypothetical protein GGR51DRAFT_416286 [Nemania sp. FL0031]|nr:hypothetical protein GGR51DRAFT_416286 [Nemania sp. FL0031]